MKETINTTLSGTVTGIFVNDNNTVLVLDKDKSKRISFFKDATDKLQQYKGRAVTITAKIVEKGGTTYYNSTPEQITTTGSAIPSSTFSRNSYDDKEKQESIVWQSMSKVAIEMLKHNATLRKTDITLEDLESLTKTLARQAYKPNLFNKTDESAKSVDTGEGVL